MSESVVHLRASPVPLSERGPAATVVVVGFGFWLFLLSDIVMFAAFFASYAVLSVETAGGPSGRDLFDHGRVLIETGCLLASSVACGLMNMSLQGRNRREIIGWSFVTLLLGCVFVAIEVAEFADMVNAGAGPTRSAFLSSFFALVGLHGLHVSLGILWLVVMIAQVATLGLSEAVMRRMLCFSLFWHALDIVWIAVFTIVYLGAG
jgi:cytochrome o ubiquinol oxidase subunit 3